MPPPVPARLLPSMIDRLLDPESMGGRVAGYDARQMGQSVRADLEQLLNTRLADPPPAAFPEAADSVLAYGIPDMCGYEASSIKSRDDLARAVSDAVVRFEPRLRRVRVTVLEEKFKGATSVRFRVEAELNVDPAPEVGFETVIELTTGHATVTAPGAAG